MYLFYLDLLKKIRLSDKLTQVRVVVENLKKAFNGGEFEWTLAVVTARQTVDVIRLNIALTFQRLFVTA